MIWRAKEDLIDVLVGAVSAKHGVSSGAVMVAASGLDVNEAAAASRVVENEVVSSVVVIRGFVLFLVDTGSETSKTCRVGIMKKRGEEQYSLDPTDRVTRELFWPAEADGFETKVKAAVEAAGHAFVGIERGTTDAAIVIAGVITATGFAERRALAYAKQDGTIGFKVEG